MTGFTAETIRLLTMDRIEFYARVLARDEVGDETRWREFAREAWRRLPEPRCR